MSRRKIIAGNWKMNKTPQQARELIRMLLPLVETDEADVVFCVPFVDIPAAVEEVSGTNVQIGAQNMYFEDAGAFTGEISPEMLWELGVEYVIIGHSERRQYFHETDEDINKKLLMAFEYDLIPIVCVGETLEQREAGETLSWIRSQIEGAFEEVPDDLARDTVIAYEPIWAIGTGKTATPEQAEDMCAFIRGVVSGIYDTATGDGMLILYGGSMKPSNAKELLEKPDINGGLIGGASLKADDFAAIAEAAASL